ncbi:MAG: YciI family protein [Gammaproteobacteria bacterium]|nr:YciI family protein [Gammaproteobacteria bacterium]
MYFAIKIYDKPDISALRDKIRQSHLDYLKKFEEQTLFAGPMITDDGELELGSHRLLDFPDRASAEAHVAAEPYIQGGAQIPGSVDRWEPHELTTWRDCPRTRGNIHFLIHAEDKPDGGELRASLQDAQERYYAATPVTYMTRGSLCSDDGKRVRGDLLMIDVPDIETAHRFWEADPRNAGGLYANVEVFRWRFGRVFDRFL